MQRIVSGLAVGFLSTITFVIVLSALLGNARVVVAQDLQAPTANSQGIVDDGELDGEWKVVSVETVLVPRPFSTQDYSKFQAEFMDATCRIADGKISVKVGRELREAEFEVDASQTPKAMDIHAILFPQYQRDAKTTAIYELKQDRLKLCFAPATSPRPRDFKPNDTDGQLLVFVIEFERVKDTVGNKKQAQSGK